MFLYCKASWKVCPSVLVKIFRNFRLGYSLRTSFADTKGSLFALSLVKRKDVNEAKFSLDVQWLAETMFAEGKINYFESCN